MKLIFVYNADSGIGNTIMDIGTKLFNPDNYGCLLCSLTHGTFREDPRWKQFRKSSATEMQFLHRDEFEERYDTHLEYPVILRKNGSLEVAFSKEEMADFESLEDLIEAVKRLQQHVD